MAAHMVICFDISVPRSVMLTQRVLHPGLIGILNEAKLIRILVPGSVIILKHQILTFSTYKYF